MKKNIVIVIPAYNEAPRIAKVVSAIPRQLKIDAHTFAIKVVVIDDCSRDATVAEAKKGGAMVLRHVMNSGAGAATRTGLRYAEYRSSDIAYVATIDADGQHAVTDIEKMVRHAIKTDSDMVVGNRLHAGNKKDMPFYRTFGNKGLSLISRMLFGITTQDTQSGLRLFKAEVLPVVADYTIDRYGFCTETLWLAFRAGLKVTEVPITVKYSQETLHKGQSNWGVIDLIKDLLWIRISR